MAHFWRKRQKPGYPLQFLLRKNSASIPCAFRNGIFCGGVDILRKLPFGGPWGLKLQKIKTAP
jgi:hypothetical protein